MLAIKPLVSLSSPLDCMENNQVIVVRTTRLTKDNICKVMKISFSFFYDIDELSTSNCRRFSVCTKLTLNVIAVQDKIFSCNIEK